MKRVFINLIAIIVVVSLCGCSHINNSNGYEVYEQNSYVENGEDSMIELNERQIEICEEMLLPTNYEELEPHQQEAIVRIEELLQHLDKKYNKHFNYVGYAPKTYLENEWLEAYSDDMHMFRTTTLYVNDDGKLADDHVCAYTALSLESELYAYALKNVDVPVKLFVGNCRTDTENLDNFSLDETLNTYVFINAVFEGELSSDAAEKHCNIITDYVKSLNISGDIRAFAVGSDDYDDITIDNFEDIKINTDAEVLYKTNF